MISRPSIERFLAILASNCWNLVVSSFSSFCEADCRFVAMFNYSVRTKGFLDMAYSRLLKAVLGIF